MNKQEKIKKVMREFKNGNLRSSDGKKVTSRKQALAIAISESEDYAEKADLISAIHIGSVREAEEILKAAGTEGDLFEKAKPGDEREYQGRMYVYGTTKSGKMGWRVKEKLKRGSSGASAGSGTTKTPTPSVDLKGITAKKASDQKSDVTIKKLDDASDGSVIKITTAQTGSNIVTFTKKDGKWYSKNTMTRGEVEASSKQVLNSIEKYNKKSYQQTVNLKAGKTSEVNEETLKKQLKEFGGKLLGLQTKDGVIGIGVQFEPRDYYAADNFVKKHKEWRATTNVDNNYEFVYLNKEGVEALRKRGFQNLPDVSNKTNSTSQKKEETASAAKKKTEESPTIVNVPAKTIAENLAKELGVVVGMPVKRKIKGLVVGLTINMYPIHLKEDTLYVHDGVFDNSYSQKRYNRSQGFTIETESGGIARYKLNGKKDGFTTAYSRDTKELAKYIKDNVMKKNK